MSERALARLAKISELHGEALLDVLMQRESMQDVLALVGRDTRLHVTEDQGQLVAGFARYDPTPNKACTQWLVQAYIRRGFRLEDLPKAEETLRGFVLYRGRLAEEQRDINRYRSLGAMWKVVEPFVVQDMPASKREEDRQLRQAARAQSSILVEEEDGFTIAIPMTELAAKWWGRGTRWCTAAEHDNRFEHYHEQAPLYVILLPDGEKLQFWAEPETNDLQFMDAADEDVSPEFIREHWDRLEPLMERMAHQVSGILHLAPEGWAREEHALSLMAKDGNRVRDLPEAFLTEAVVQAACARSPLAAYELPEHLKTPERLLAALREAPDVGMLPTTPRHFLNEAFLLEVLAISPSEFPYVPKELRSDAVVMAALRGDGTNLKLLPLEERTPERCEAAVRSNGYAYREVPEALHSREMLRLALLTDPSSFDLDDAVVTPALAAFAVETNPECLMYLPLRLLDEDHLVDAVKRAPRLFEELRRRSVKPGRAVFQRLAEAGITEESHRASLKAELARLETLLGGRRLPCLPGQEAENTVPREALPGWRLVEQVAQAYQASRMALVGGMSP